LRTEQDPFEQEQEQETLEKRIKQFDRAQLAKIRGPVVDVDDYSVYRNREAIGASDH